MGRVNGNMLRSPRGRQAESRRQKALGSPRRVAKIDKALAAGPDLSDEQEKASQGWPRASIDTMLALFADVRAGSASIVTDTVERVTGRAPFSFQKFALDYSPRFGTSS